MPQGNIFAANFASPEAAPITLGSGLPEGTVRWHQLGDANCAAILRAERMRGRGLRMAGTRRRAKRASVGLWDAARWNSEIVWKYLDKWLLRPRSPRTSRDLPPSRRKCWRDWRPTMGRVSPMRSAPRDFSSIPAREAFERRLPPSASKPANTHVGATLGFGSERRQACHAYPDSLCGERNRAGNCSLYRVPIGDGVEPTLYVWSAAKAHSGRFMPPEPTVVRDVRYR